MLEDIKDAVEKKRDLEIKDMQGATAVSFLHWILTEITCVSCLDQTLVTQVGIVLLC